MENENQQELIKEAEIRAAIHIAADTFKFKPEYNERDRELVLEHKLTEELTKAGGKITMIDGKLTLVSANNPQQQLLDASGKQVTIQSLLHPSLQVQSVETERVTDPLTGNTSWTAKNGDRHTIVGGNHEYVFPSFKPRPDYGLSPQQAAQQRLDKLLQELRQG